MNLTHDNAPLPVVSPRLLRWFLWYAPRYVAKHFHAVRLHGELPDLADPRPRLIYCNHPSWWDPMIVALLMARPFRGWIAYGPIDANALAQYRLLGRLGFFGIDMVSAAGPRRFLEVGQAVLSLPRHMLWVTAEGHFTDARQRPVTLRPGVAHLARRAGGAVALPLAIEYDFGSEKRPEVRLKFGEALPLGDRDLAAGVWSERLTEALAATMDTLAAASLPLARQPDAPGFQTLLDGQRGNGGIYGLWQRTLRALRGQGFDAAGHTELTKR